MGCMLATTTMNRQGQCHSTFLSRSRTRELTRLKDLLLANTISTAAADPPRGRIEVHCVGEVRIVMQLMVLCTILVNIDRMPRYISGSDPEIGKRESGAVYYLSSSLPGITIFNTNNNSSRSSNTICLWTLEQGYTLPLTSKTCTTDIIQLSFVVYYLHFSFIPGTSY